MQIRIISDIKQLKKIQKDWENLFMIGEYSVFQRFEFNYYSWEVELSKNNQNILCIVEVRSKGMLSAILPLYVDSRKRLRFINDKHADFCDVLANEEFDFENILSEISNQFKLNSVHLINLAEDSFLYDLYKKKVWKNRLSKPFEKYSDLIIPAGSFPDNILRYTSKQKTEFRRVKKKNADNTYHLLLKDEANFPIEEILQLKERMISLGLRKISFLNEDRLLFLKELYHCNRIIVSMVKDKRNIHAISFILRNANEYLFWIDMYDDTKMINIYNYISFIENISFKNSVKISFGRGVYDYKLINFKPDIKVLFAVFIFKNKLQRAVFVFLERIKMMIKLMYRSITT